MRAQDWEDAVSYQTGHKHQQCPEPQEQEGALCLLWCALVRLLHCVFSLHLEDVMAVGQALSAA